MKKVAGMAIACVVLTVACQSIGPQVKAPTVDVTGKWAGNWTSLTPGLGSGQIEMTVKQTGSEYTGNLLATGTRLERSGFTRGIVSGNQLQVIEPTGLTGTLTVTGDSITGTLQGQITGNVTLNREK
jgi:hypothetical protein